MHHLILGAAGMIGQKLAEAVATTGGIGGTPVDTLTLADVVAASPFFSGILREPLNGMEAVLPVDNDVRYWFASPRCAAGFIEHAASKNKATFRARRSLTMPGLSATVADQIDALREMAGEGALAPIRRVPDPAVARIVASWPRPRCLFHRGNILPQDH